jgi:para-nitrobenzyl esterase
VSVLIRNACLLLLAVATGAASALAVAADAPINTTSGRVVGQAPDGAGIRAFLGIPYADPPTGRRRFLPPLPSKPSSKILHAVNFGSVSAQRQENEEAEEYGDFFDENSLSLNVWTPGLTGHRPVMVWIHGGGNTQGASREAQYNGARLAARGNVVVVSLNYRLGIFGFVDVSVIGGPRYRESCNDGLLDQLMALEWIKRNIAAFGGDPHNVTVFGNSAGASDISALLGVQTPERYFQRAIIQSGFASATKSRAIAEQFSRSMFSRAHVRSMKDLLGKSPKELLAMQAAALEPLSELDSDLSFQPTVDGTLIRDFPLALIRRGNARHVDVLLGYTVNELRLYLLYTPGWANAKLTDIPVLRDLTEDKRRALWDEYRQARPEMSDGQVALDIGSDYLFRVSAIRMAEAQLPHNKNVFVYQFAWKASKPELGAPHAVELPFVFGNVGSGQSLFLGNMDEPQTRSTVESLVSEVQELWTSFAKSGRPTAQGVPEWPRYDTDSRRTMIFDRTVQLMSDPASKERALFEGLALGGRR